MGASLGTTGKKFDVDLNIVPFIDLMSCLTAFLLVTAAWTNTAAMDMRPKGKATTGFKCVDDPDTCDPPLVSILVASDEVWLGISRVHEYERIPNLASGPDWQQVADRLKAHKDSPMFDGHDQAEVAVESTEQHPLPYQHMVSAMDAANRAGFHDVGVTDVRGLTTPPRQ